MIHRLTITLFAMDTQGDRPILCGLPHIVTFKDEGQIFQFGEIVGLGMEIGRLLHRPLLDTVMIQTTKLAWTYTPSLDDPESDQITKDGRTFGTALREFGLTRDCAIALRTLARLVPIAAPQAILHLDQIA